MVQLITSNNSISIFSLDPYNVPCVVGGAIFSYMKAESERVIPFLKKTLDKWKI